MAWRDNLLKASYKNIRFEVESHDTGVGRRTALHEYANRSNPYAQDMGKKADEFTINGYIVQNPENNFDYFTGRNRLMRAFKSYGPGILVHPSLGIQRVSVKGHARFREMVSEGGIVKFTVTFVEAGARLPNIVEQGKELIDNWANVSQDSSGDDFNQNYKTSGQFVGN